ncbi:MAG: hypothetical protein LBT94_06265 [Prevotellaceae bacterium]|jgi:hypothetical protein|nr:hypothetical protein [Prevotellaceae bacterium]
MRRIFFIAILLLLDCFALLATTGKLALSDASLRFRAAGVDIATQKFYLQWSVPNLSDTADIKGFWVLRLTKDTQANPIMDTLNEVSSRAMRYLDTVTPCCEPSMYTINLIPKNPSDGGTAYKPPLQTMLLDPPMLDECKHVINLQWSAYRKFDMFSMPPEPDASFAGEVRYHLYGYIGGSAFKPDSATWLATSDGATSFALPITKEKQYYHLYVAAVYNGGSDTSYSNRVSLFVSLPIRPQHIYLDSVIGEGPRATLHFRIDTATEYTRFWAEKSSDINGEYHRFGELADKHQRSATDEAQGSVYSFYRISAVNGCGQVTASSPVVTNLVPNLVPLAFGELSPSIRWNMAVWHDGGGSVARHAQQYSVYRTSPSGVAGLVDSTTETSIRDDLSHLSDSVICSARICYRVEAAICNDSRQPLAYVRSSEACTDITPNLLMPNAVQPYGEEVNPSTGKSRRNFEPLCACMKSYTLSVYSPSGALIYSGAEPWNGRKSNSENFVSEGTYIYHIKITFVSGEQVQKTGTVTVVF